MDFAMLDDINSMFRWTPQAFFFHEKRYTYDKLPIVLQVLGKNFGIELVPAIASNEIMEEATESDGSKPILSEIDEINPKPHFCENCNKEFARKWNLQRHILNCTNV
jgi:hypothetical protein